MDFDDRVLKLESMIAIVFGIREYLVGKLIQM